MWKYIVKRILLMLLTTFIILSLTFILMKMLKMQTAPGTAEQQKAFYDNQVALGYMYIVTDHTVASDVTLAPIGGVVWRYNIYPVMYQYFIWIRNIVTKWDWGTSTRIAFNDSVMTIIARRLPYSMKLNVWAMVFSIPLGFILGIWAALKKNKPADHTISTLVMVFISVPSFVIISFLMKILAYDAGWLPTQWPSDGAPLAIRIQGYIIPVMCLCFGTVAGFTRYTRAELTEVMSSEFLLLARTKGLTKSQTVIRHALRNSLVPIVPMIIGEFIGILSGSMILEQLYGIPGIGSLFVTAITVKDYNVIMVDMAVYTMIGLVAILLVDLSYGIVDPRIRMGARK
ncbi:MAG TPA: ABC transporter permease [Bacilli bacterium]|nr:ABC transporter permease [Bacilli bacterium]